MVGTPMTLGAQLFVSRGGPPAKGEYPDSPVDNKPFRALWTSTYRPVGLFASAWVEFAVGRVSSTDHWVSSWTPPAYLLYPSRVARVFHIDSRKDGDALIREFPSGEQRYLAAVDWIAVAKEFDGVHMTSRGEGATRAPTRRGISFDGWDVESTAWFRYSFDHVERYKDPLVRL